MKKIGKIILGVLLILGCSGGVIFDNSGILVKKAWAITYNFNATTLPDGAGNVATLNGQKVEALSCDLGESKVIYVTYDGGKTLKMYHKDSSKGCKSLLDEIYDGLKGKNFTMAFDKSSITGDNYSASSKSGEVDKSFTVGGTTIRGSSLISLSCVASGSNYRLDIKTNKESASKVYSTADECNGVINSAVNDAKNAGFETSGASIVKASGSSPSTSSEAPKMNILKMCEESEGEEAIKCVLRLVVNIMTYGIGVLGVVGIVLSGIQYITSQGDPAKMAKAKNRIIQVVIGLVIYAVMYAALVFLVPGFNADLTSFSGP